MNNSKTKRKHQKNKLSQRLYFLLQNKTIAIVFLCFLAGGIFVFTSKSTSNGEIFPKKDYAAISLAMTFLITAFICIYCSNAISDSGALSIAMIFGASFILWKNIYGFIPDYIWHENLMPSVKKSRILNSEIYKSHKVDCEKMILVEMIEIPFDGSICIDSSLNENINDTLVLTGKENGLAFYVEHISVLKNTKYGAK